MNNLKKEKCIDDIVRERDMLMERVNHVLDTSISKFTPTTNIIKKNIPQTLHLMWLDKNPLMNGIPNKCIRQCASRCGPE